MNFALKTRSFVSKTRNFALKMMNVAELVSKKRFVDLFERRSVDEFEVETDTDLGPLQTVHLSTDGKGAGAGCKQIFTRRNPHHQIPARRNPHQQSSPHPHHILIKHGSR